MWEQLNQAALRLEELETQLAQPETYENPDLVAALNREQKELTPLVETFHHYQGAQRELAGLTDLLSDPECRQLARAEYDQVKAQLDQLEQTLRQMLLPKDPMDGKNVFAEIRAGVGGRRRPFCGGPLPNVRHVRGEAGLEAGAGQRQPHGTGGHQGTVLPGGGGERLCQAQA